MGLAKNPSTTEVTTAVEIQPGGQASSGTDAALERLKNLSKESVGSVTKLVTGEPKAQYKQRDFDKEARGKTRCVQFEAALMSPAIAGMQFNNMKEYLALVKEAADAGVAYSFQEE